MRTKASLEYWHNPVDLILLSGLPSGPSCVVATSYNLSLVLDTAGELDGSTVLLITAASGCLQSCRASSD